MVPDWQPTTYFTIYVNYPLKTAMIIYRCRQLQLCLGELEPSGRLVCRYHDVFLWFYVCFILLRFRLQDFVEAAALGSICKRPDMIATRVSFSFFLGNVAFSEYVFVPFPLSLCTESTPYALSFRMLFFYLVTTGSIFDISLSENSLNQSNMKRAQLKFWYGHTLFITPFDIG